MFFRDLQWQYAAFVGLVGVVAGVEAHRAKAKEGGVYPVPLCLVFPVREAGGGVELEVQREAVEVPVPLFLLSC